MQKRLIQTSMLLVFSSQAMAYTLIENDRANLTAYGTMKARAKFSDTVDNDYTFGDSDVGVRGRYAIMDSISIAAGAEAEINFDRDETEDEDDIYMSEYFVGLGVERLGTLTYGKHSTSSDDLSAVDYSEIYGGKASLNTVGVKDETIKYVYGYEGIKLDATYGFASGENSRELKEFYGSYSLEDLKLQAGIGNSTTKTYTYNYSQLSAFYTFGDYQLGTSYYYNKAERKSNSLRDVERNAIAVAGQLQYTPELTTFAGYEFIHHKSKTDTLEGNEQNIYAGVSYLVDDWLKLFTEVNYRETLTQNQVNYGVGASFSF